MNDCMQYDPFEGQGYGHEPLQSWKFGRFQKLSPPPFTKGAGNWPPTLKLGHNI